MTTSETFRDRLRAHWARMAYSAAVAGLAAGFLMYLLRQHGAASVVLAATCCLLMALPVVNVVMVLIEEVRRRDWAFVVLAIAVLALIGWTIATRL